MLLKRSVDKVMKPYILAFHISCMLFPGILCCELPAEGRGAVLMSDTPGRADTLQTDRQAAADSLASKADSLRCSYRFLEAVSLYRQALDLEPDSLKAVSIENRKLQGENGLNMMQFVYKPKVVAKHRFSTDDFFLYYPMKDSSWRRVPNVLDTLGGHPYAKAVYVPEGSSEIYFSAVDDENVRNIWKTAWRDSVWSLPSLLNEQVTSPSDEIYPLVSRDGRCMYFSSAGLYGVGGYDLYVSEWDDAEKDWGVPVNMGFPYSSPYDDMLCYNTPDGRFTVFASNRDCPADSINVYVLEYDNMPIHGAVGSAEELEKIMALEPDHTESSEMKAEPEPEMPQNPDVRRYMQKIEEVRALKDSISLYNRSMDEQREKYASTPDEYERAKISDEIIKRESLLPVFGDSLKRATEQLQAIEMEFLFNGVVIDLDRVAKEADREIVPKNIDYTFVKMNMGDTLVLNMERPEPEFDYTFMVLPEGRFALDNTLPAGIVYQIQIFSLTRPATLRDINGLSPVFLHRTDTGRYTYAVGVFASYSDALSQLNKVRNRGFKSAYIVAYRDGQPLSVTQARKMER